MTTYSLRCRNSACRHRRVSKTHPDDYKRPPACQSCGQRAGWRIEDRAYNKRNLCDCNGPEMVRGAHFPHRETHPFCDKHERGYYNQARQRGLTDDEIPVAYGGTMTEELETA